MPKVIHKEVKEQVVDPVVAKVKQYITIKGRIDDLSKEQSVLKTELSDLVDSAGTPDEKGHIWYSLPEEVDGYTSLQRQRRVSQKLDEDVAKRILASKNLTDRCFKMIPVLDEAEVMSCLYEDLLTEEEIDEMFPKSVSYAFLTSKQ